ncbi:MAG: type II toxin-antitoxin system HicA family toxin [Burkholderiaceae bacterium]
MVAFIDASGTAFRYHASMRRKSQRTLALVFAHPTSGSIPWRDIESLFVDLGADVSERQGSRVAIFLFGEVRVFHRPHPSPSTDKGAVASVRKWLEQHGVVP